MVGNTANQFISKGVSNYDVAEAVASSTATAASIMGMGFMSGAASSAGSKAALKVAGNAMKKAGAKAAGKAWVCMEGGAHQAYIDYIAVPEDWIETAPASWK